MRRLLYLLVAAGVTACTQIDCPVNNLVTTQYVVWDGDQTELTLTDTLTITTLKADGRDTTLLNRGIGISSFSLPISYNHPEDVLVMRLANDSVVTVDTVWIKKEDTPHFESVDCNASFFHEITSLRCTTRGIDSIVINNPTVNYDNTTVHFILFPKAVR